VIILMLVLLYIVFCMMRIPVPFSLGLSSLVIIYYIGVSPQQMVIQLYKGLQFFPLLAVPFFLLLGNLLNKAGVTEDLIRFAQSIVGRIRGGLAHVNILVSMIFGGISGSSTADTAAVGAIMIPAMVKVGYTPSFSAAITAASSTMGNIIPPSIFMIIYGALANVSIESLFLAGIIPGILIGVTQMIYSYFHARKHKIPIAEKIVFIQARTAFFKSVPALIVIFLVTGGILFGWFTATEASLIAVVYTLLIVLFYYRTVKVKQLPKLFFNTAMGFGAILITIGAASVFGFLIAYLKGPLIVKSFLEGVGLNPNLLLLSLSLVLIILGTFLSQIATIVIFMPIFLEIQALWNIDPIHMGVIVVMTLCLGLITPPYGVCLLIASQISKDRLTTTTKEVFPLIIVFVAVIVMIIFFPQIALFIPKVVQSFR